MDRPSSTKTVPKDEVEWFEAASIGNLQALRIQLAAGRQVDVRRSAFDQDRTALHLAVQAELPECVELLLQARADPNQTVDWGDFDDRSALHLAARNGNARIVELLLQAGADPEQVTGDDYGRATALQLSQSDRVRKLLSFASKVKMAKKSKL
eukprot:gb/GEZN01021607.1/.p1 GENE.gb/GEZN01021607.1/~~gb/GEZN01021607.1/.p1  ORF type:complete len:153 (+),score=29.48 gb/GEZN01021607.1/:37-495(+)